MTKLDTLIDSLVEEAVPVRPHSAWVGRALLVLIGIATIAVTFLLFGVREDVAAFGPAPAIAVAGGLMALVAVAAGIDAVRMARPQVGAQSSGPAWSLAALLVIPAVALVGAAADPARLHGLALEDGLRCLAVGLVAGAATIAFLYFWQRRGAPVQPERAAWLAGLAGGAVGALAVTLECPLDSLAHVWVWHVAAVPLSGLAARLVLPRFLRW